MALADIKVLSSGPFGTIGSKKVNVAAGATAINSGEPVIRALGAAVGTVMLTNSPVVATTFVEGIATSTSTQTASLAGTVEVTPLVPGIIYLIAPKVAATFDTQAEYDALVGDRVLIDLTAGVYTILAVDGATSGCVIEPLIVADHPGKVAFSFRNGVSPLT